MGSETDGKKRIEFAEDDAMERMAPLARDFFTKVFDMDFDDCFVSDESWISDFSGCGITPAQSDAIEGSLVSTERNAKWNEFTDRWFEVIAIRVLEIYGVKPASRSETLVSFFERISQVPGGAFNAKAGPGFDPTRSYGSK